MSIRETLQSGPLGYGGATLGNMFRKIPDDEAWGTVAAAWDQGIRYFDTAPFYDAGLSELRVGKVLSQHKREEYALSTKVGPIIRDEIETGERQFGEKVGLFEHGRPNKIVYDYSEQGTLKSIEDSLARLGIEQLDYVWVHDIAQDFHGDAWLSVFEMARNGAFRALSRLCEQGKIKAWGLGVNRVEPCELALGLKEFRPNALLLARRYSLLDHETALQRLMPKAAELNVDVVVGGPYSSGVLVVVGDHFEYQKAPPDILAKVAQVKLLADRYAIPIKAAALNVKVPDAFWHDLRRQGLVAPNAPLPIDR
jgi:D-threo-aldose 1-dehydrogenase